MRWALVLLVAAGCGIGHGKDPAWPKDRPVEAENDGGESLAPRAAASVVASSAATDDDDADTKVATPAAASGDKAADKPAADKPATSITAPEDVINLDDIIIEIDD
ncbi:MAG TPA: hypothetical protein VGM90_24220 [Kofleriaceae bacterium]|jgi:hypothetical protein